jgi:GxxExxY protein
MSDPRFTNPYATPTPGTGLAPDAAIAVRPDARTQAAFPVVYKGECVGEYFADILVEDSLLLELKCCEGFSREHLAQCLNYLKASGKNIALLVNFQKPKAEWKRVVLGL